jgi:integrase
MADGFIRKRGDAWQVIVYAGRDPITGRKRQLSRNVRGRSAKPRRCGLACSWKSTMDITSRLPASFGELVEQWFEHASPDWSPKTASETRRLIDKIVKPRLARMRLTRLKTADLDRLYASLRKSGDPTAVRWLPRPSGGCTRSCGERCSRGVRWGWLSSNPAVHASPPRVPRTSITPPSPLARGRTIMRHGRPSGGSDARREQCVRDGGC